MKLLNTFFLALLLPLIFSSNVYAEKLKVAASIFPLGSLVQEIGGEDVEVFTLLAKNVSPHVYEPAPKDVIRLRESRAFFLIGLGLEPWAQKLVREKETTELKVIKTGDFFAHEKESLEEKHEGHHHGGINPHIWLSPEYAGKIAEVIFQELSLLKPEAKDRFVQNYQEFLHKLHGVQQKIDELKKKTAGKDIRIVTFHNSFSYLFDALHIEKVKAIEPFPGKKPSLKRLKELVDFMKDGDVAAVFTEPQFSGRMTEVIVSETGAKKGVLDPVGCPSCNERNGYINLMHYNLQQIESLL